MALTTIIDYEALRDLFHFSNELCKRLDEARSALTDEQWDKHAEGDWADIICAAMDVEDAWINCDKSRS